MIIKYEHNIIVVSVLKPQQNTIQVSPSSLPSEKKHQLNAVCVVVFGVVNSLPHQCIQ